MKLKGTKLKGKESYTQFQGQLSSLYAIQSMKLQLKGKEFRSVFSIYTSIHSALSLYTSILRNTLYSNPVKAKLTLTKPINNRGTINANPGR